LRFDARPRVFDFYDDALTLSEDARGQCAAALHRLEGVDDKVDDDLLELLAVADRDAAVGRDLPLEREAPRGRGLALEIANAVYETADVHGLARDPAGPSQVEEFREQPVEAADFVADDFDAVLHGRALVVVDRRLVDVAAEQPELQDCGVQRVSDLVR